METKEEEVCDGSLFWKRIPCPGGWIYSACDKSCPIGGIVFIPDSAGNAEYCKTKLAYKYE